MLKKKIEVKYFTPLMYDKSDILLMVKIQRCNLELVEVFFKHYFIILDF